MPEDENVCVASLACRTAAGPGVNANVAHFPCALGLGLALPIGRTIIPRRFAIWSQVATCTGCHGSDGNGSPVRPGNPNHISGVADLLKPGHSNNQAYFTPLSFRSAA